MKKADIKIGQEYAVTRGVGGYDRRLDRDYSTLRAKVVDKDSEYKALRSPWGGGTHKGVRVKWVSSGSLSMDPSVCEANYGKGVETVVPTRWLWMPWDEYVEAVKRAEQDQVESKTKADRRRSQLEQACEKLGLPKSAIHQGRGGPSDMLTVRLDEYEVLELAGMGVDDD